MIIRRPDWAQRLTEFMTEHRQAGTVCDWTEHNCASWVADAIKLMDVNETDLCAEFRGKSKSPASTFRLIKAEGYSSLEEIIVAKLQPKPLAFVTRGDVILYPVGDMYVSASSARLEGPPGGLDGGGDKGGKQRYSDLGMAYAVCLAEPPIAWNLSETGIEAVSITSDCLAFDVGGLVCPQQ